MLYSGVDSNSRASKEVAIYVDRKSESRITNYKYVNELIISMILEHERGNLTILGVHASEEGKKEESQAFYNNLRKNLNNVLKATVLY
jgi:hypothetical protein